MTPQADERCERLEVRVARMEEQLTAMRNALTLASVDLDRRMVELNNVRNRFLDKNVYESEHVALIKRVQELESLNIGEASKHEAYSKIWANAAIWIALAISATWLLTHFIK